MSGYSIAMNRQNGKLLKEITALREQVEKLEALIVMRCDLEVPPQFSQGLQPHEVLEPVTAEHCRWFVAEIEKLTKERDKYNQEFKEACGALCKQSHECAALAEQNEKLRSVLENHAGNYKLTKAEGKAIDEILELPNLASPVLNQPKVNKENSK